MMDILSECWFVPGCWLMRNLCGKGCLLKWELLTSMPALMADNVLAGNREAFANASRSGSSEESLDEETIRKENLMRLKRNKALLVEEAGIKKGSVRL